MLFFLTLFLKKSFEKQYFLLKTTRNERIKDYFLKKKNFKPQNLQKI